MASIDRWVQSIQKDVPEPLESVIARQVVFAMQDFFRASEAWRLKGTANVMEGTNTVSLADVPENCYAVALDWAYFSSDKKGRRRLDTELYENIDPANRWSNAYTRTIALDNEGETLLLDSDREGGTLEYRVIVQPTELINELPDSLANKWFDYIRRGAMARLLGMPNKPWSNGKQSDKLHLAFIDGVALAKREAKRHRSRPRRVAKFNRGFMW